jgi:hypothetical protein
MRLARKVMAGRACTVSSSSNGEEEQRKAYTNEWVRRKLGTHTCESELSRRRVKWYKTMLRHPEDNKLLRAALTGQLEIDEDEHTRFTPWIELLMEDLSKLADILDTTNWVEKKIREQARVEGRHQNGDFMWDLTEILEWDEDKLRKFEQTEDKKRQEEGVTTETPCVTEHTCEICQYKGNKQQVAMHMSKTHKKRRKLINYVPGNYCPLCNKVFANQRTAVQHLENLEVRYKKDPNQTGCKTKNMNKGEPYKKTKLSEYECGECNKTFKLDQIDPHLRMHINNIIFDTTMNPEEGRPMGVLGMLMRTTG